MLRQSRDLVRRDHADFRIVRKSLHQALAQPKLEPKPESKRRVPERRDEDQAANLATAIEAARQLAAVKAPAGAELNDMMNEIRSMRGMLEAQLAELAWVVRRRNAIRSRRWYSRR